MKSLEDFAFRDEHGKDQGINGELKELNCYSLATAIIMVTIIIHCPLPLSSTEGQGHTIIYS